MGARRARLVGVDRLARANAPVSPDRRVDRPAPRRRPPVDEGQVLAHDPPRRERRLEAPVRRLALRHDEEPRGVAVEPVDDARPPRLPARGTARGQGLRQRRAAVPAGRVHDHAGWLVDDQQVLVLVGDRERRRRVGDIDLGLRRRGDRDRLAAAEPVVLARGRPVERDGAGFDPPLRLRAGAEALGEEPVEARAGRLRRYAQRLHRGPGSGSGRSPQG
jgi:hypothetical protein